MPIGDVTFEGTLYHPVASLPSGEFGWPGSGENPAVQPPAPVIEHANDTRYGFTFFGGFPGAEYWSRTWSPNIEWAQAQLGPDNQFLVVVDFSAVAGWAAGGNDTFFGAGGMPVPVVEAFLKADDWDTGDDFTFTRTPYPDDQRDPHDPVYPWFFVHPDWPWGTGTQKVIPHQIDQSGYSTGHAYLQLQAFLAGGQDPALLDALEWAVLFPDLTPPVPPEPNPPPTPRSGIALSLSGVGQVRNRRRITGRHAQGVVLPPPDEVIAT